MWHRLPKHLVNCAKFARGMLVCVSLFMPACTAGTVRWAQDSNTPNSTSRS